MSRKPHFCLRSEKSRIKCASCNEPIEDIDFDTGNSEKADEITKRMTAQGRAKECFGCDHKVYVCEECKDEETVICACCLEVVEESLDD